MTEIVCELVTVPEPIPIEGADRIEARQIGGYTVVSLKNQFKPGDLGLFISIDSVVPLDFLKHYDLDTVIKNGRVRTKKLRGIFSEGLLLPLTHPIFDQVNKQEGEKLGDLLSVHKYEPPVKGQSINCNPTRRWVAENYHVYDIENIQNPHNREIFLEGDQVAITEKIHGMHCSYGWLDDTFFYTSRRYSLLEPEDPNPETVNNYYRPVLKYGLKDKLRMIQQDYDLKSIALRGEIYGHGVQNLTYGLEMTKDGGIDFAAFDVELGFNTYAGEEEFRGLMQTFGIPTVPILHVGTFSYELADKLAELNSKLAQKNGVQQEAEGIVIKDRNEGQTTSNNRYLKARKILKQVSKRYKASEGYGEEVADQ